jgi:hypothetical protein
MDFKNIFIIIIILLLFLFLVNKQFKENYQQQDPYLNEIVEDICQTFPKARNLRFLVGDSSYTINKEKVYICLKDKNNDKYYDKQILIYVILHEYTHSICPEIGHTKLFFEMFDQVLEEAVDRKLYNPSTNIPDDYCKLRK